MPTRPGVKTATARHIGSRPAEQILSALAEKSDITLTELRAERRQKWWFSNGRDARRRDRARPWARGHKGARLVFAAVSSMKTPKSGR